MVTMEEFQQRRQTLFEKMAPNSVAILFAAEEKIRTGDAHYPFRQNSDFWYLSGFPETQAIIVLENKRGYKATLFCRPKDPKQEVWTGVRVGPANAQSDFKFDAAKSVETFEESLKGLLEGIEVLYYDAGVVEHDQRLLPQLDFVKEANPSFVIESLGALLHEMRLIKSEGEVALMQKAASLSAKAHVEAIKACKVGMHECELSAIMQGLFLKEGHRPPAYNPIVAAGKNACILHYDKNTDRIEDGDMVLMDVGVEYDGYASDITRTFPANGQFTEAQRALYTVVLDTQQAVINAIKPGVPITTLQKTALHVLVEGLVHLGILQGDVDSLIAEKAFLPFYMHGVSHWLGLDTHDVGAYKLGGKPRALAPGMVLTVEPGLYVSPSNDVDKKWWNTGIRIEDDVVVTESGCHVLTHEVPKSPEDIEALMRA